MNWSSKKNTSTLISPNCPTPRPGSTVTLISSRLVESLISSLICLKRKNKPNWMK